MPRASPLGAGEVGLFSPKNGSAPRACLRPWGAGMGDGMWGCFLRGSGALGEGGFGARAASLGIPPRAVCCPVAARGFGATLDLGS